MVDSVENVCHEQFYYAIYCRPSIFMHAYLLHTYMSRALQLSGIA